MHVKACSFLLTINANLIFSKMGPSVIRCVLPEAPLTLNTQLLPAPYLPPEDQGCAPKRSPHSSAVLPPNWDPNAHRSATYSLCRAHSSSPLMTGSGLLFSREPWWVPTAPFTLADLRTCSLPGPAEAYPPLQTYLPPWGCEHLKGRSFLLPCLQKSVPRKPSLKDNQPSCLFHSADPKQRLRPQPAHSWCM